MQMPSRKDYPNGESYLRFLNEWMAASEAFYRHLRDIFDGTPPTTKKPEWLTAFSRGDRKSEDINIANISIYNEPTSDELEAALRNLAGNIFHNGGEITRVCHGIMWTEWRCYAEWRKTD
jgi:hypothetical protein